MRSRLPRLGIVLAFVFALLPLANSLGGGKSKWETFDGKVVPLADLLTKANETKLDADASPFHLVLVTEKGDILPLIKDAGSRMFFKDEKLRNRPMRLTGKLLPNSKILQVITVNSVVKGQLHDVYYWCDICTIKRFEGGICDCCGMNLDFREEPMK